ncbi:hypothetical protein [Aquimarina sp. 2201CG5-10]|uniref:hypothetical protein n=1 Tax=Aquimarina callyspongiae TaxID=3098150 RepID=UPI002AB50334|nr:hypothetical protein [Aquimarina sp. 2201CG5-10]MDY8135444.1 hypothetical protein [Aquimarina sp. 2201CG5-10]
MQKGKVGNQCAVFVENGVTFCPATTHILNVGSNLPKLMNKKLILIFLITIVQNSRAQDCDFKIRNLSDILSVKSELINKSEYDKVDMVSEKFIELSSKSEIELTKEYPKIFNLKDSCYTFLANKNIGIGIKIPELKACKNRIQTKENSDYKFLGTYCHNALIEINGYESWGFLSVDLKNGLACFTMGEPLTSGGETAISHSNYYGEEEIALTNLKTKEQYVIRIEGWRTMESIVSKNNYYLKLESEFQTDCKKEVRYLKIEPKN